MSEAKDQVGGGQEPTSRQTELLWHYLDRINAGEAVDPEELLREHPAIGPELLCQLEAFQRLSSSPEPDAPLGVLGDYTLHRQIGRGGMGVVYEAWQNSLDRQVALKVLPAGAAADTKSYTRFLREAQIAARIHHPNVVAIHGFGVEQHTPYYAMDLVEGETLAQILGRLKDAEPAAGTPFGASREELAFYSNVARSFAEVAEGLQHAHFKGVIHRDIKPSNLILDHESRLRILDFGLARLEGQESLTISGDFIGTPRYMSPEQARARKVPIDHRTDVYSLGATLYEMLTWRPPFLGKDQRDTLSQIIDRDPLEPRKLNPRVPRDLETIGLKCMRKDPDDRYATAEALAQDLRRFVRGDPIEARPQPGWERLTRKVWRSRLRVGMFAGIALLLLVSGLLALKVRRDAHARREEDYDHRVLEGVRGMNLGRLLTAVQTRQSKESSSDWNHLTEEDLAGLLREEAQGDVETALEVLRQAALEVPGRPEAYYHRARGLLLIRRSTEALVDLDRALEASPAFAPAAALKASILEDQGDAIGAKRVLDGIRVLDVEGWAAAWLEARHASRWLRGKQAASAYGKLIELEERGREAYLGSFLEARLGRGWARFDHKDLLGALEDCVVAQSRWPEALEPQVLKGMIYASLDHDAEAESLFEDMYLRAGSRRGAALCVVAAYDALLDAERGLAWCDKLEAERHGARMRALFLWRLGRFEEAVGAGRKALELCPDDPRVHRLLAFVLSEGLARYEDAAEVSREALRRFPDHVALYVALETPLWRTGRFAEARDVLRDALKLNPNDGCLHSELGWMLVGTGELEEAFREHARALELAPQDNDTYNNWGCNLLDVGRFEEAIGVFAKGIQVLPFLAAGNRLNPGRALEQLGRLDEALRETKKGVLLEPRWAWSYLRLGSLLERQGDADAAFTAYAEGLEVFPRDDELLKQVSLLQHRESRAGALAARWDRLVAFLEKARAGRAEDGRLLNALALARLHGETRQDLAKALDLALEAARLSGRKEPDVLATLAAAQVAAGEKAAAVATLEEALERPEAERCLERRLEAYRKAALPELPSYASIDAALEGSLLDDFRGAVAGEGTSDYFAYLEAKRLERAGHYREAAESLSELVAREAGRPEPALALARCFRNAGAAATAEERLRAALAGSLASRRELWDLWMGISLADLGRPPAEVLEHLPETEAGATVDAREDYRWLLEQLRDADTIRIRASGGEHRGPTGKLWGRDRFFSGGRAMAKAWLAGSKDSFPGEVKGTEDAALYRQHRWFPREQYAVPGYRLPLPNGTYRVTLHFAEIWWGAAGLRRFDVRIEGQEVLQGYDPFATAGFATADVRAFETTVSDGVLDVVLVPRVDSAMLSALEVEWVK